MNNKYYLVAFPSTHTALKAEEFFEKSAVKAKLIPIPSAISAGCGLALKILPTDKERAEPLLKSDIFAEVSFYQVEKVDRQTIVEEWAF